MDNYERDIEAKIKKGIEKRKLMREIYGNISGFYNKLDKGPHGNKRTLDKHNKIEIDKENMICSCREEWMSPGIREPFQINWDIIFKDKKGKLWLRMDYEDYVCWNCNYKDKLRYTMRIYNTPENMIIIEKIKVLIEQLKEIENDK